LLHIKIKFFSAGASINKYL